MAATKCIISQETSLTQTYFLSIVLLSQDFKFLRLNLHNMINQLFQISISSC